MKKHFIFSILLAVASHTVLAQTRKEIDDAKRELAVAENDTSRVLILAELCDLYRSTDSAQQFGQKALTLAQKINFPKGKARALTNYGGAFYDVGNYPKALGMLLDAVQIAEDNHLEKELAGTHFQMGNLYSALNDYRKALDYYKMSLSIYERYHDGPKISLVKMHMGRRFLILNRLDSALYYEQQAYDEMLDRSKGNEINPLVYRNLASIQFKLGNVPLALEYGHKGLQVSYKTNFRWGIAYSLVELARFYQKINQRDSSLYYAKLGLEEAQRISNRRNILLACSLLSELYESTDTKEAFRYYKMAGIVKDSLFGAGSIQAFQEILAQNQERKIVAENAKRAYQSQLRQYGLLAGLAVLLLVAYFLYRNNKRKQEANKVLGAEKKEVEKQRNRSDELLLNILPSEVAEELKENGKAKARQFDNVTVMFTDFKNFTGISEKLSAKELVAEIDTCFKAFDNIITKCNIEKIKTIGDSYMCAGGLPIPNETNATDIVNAALDIQQFIKLRVELRIKEAKLPFEIRIGVHTGPVVAGIVGSKKFAYDIWGDTVNIASRMESSGEAGRLNVSQSTYDRIKNDANFRFEPRGKIEAKNKGAIEMYFVERN